MDNVIMECLRIDMKIHKGIYRVKAWKIHIDSNTDCMENVCLSDLTFVCFEYVTRYAFEVKFK